jgi:hypothetical protein
MTVKRLLCFYAFYASSCPQHEAIQNGENIGGRIDVQFLCHRTDRSGQSKHSKRYILLLFPFPLISFKSVPTSYSSIELSFNIPIYCTSRWAWRLIHPVAGSLCSPCEFCELSTNTVVAWGDALFSLCWKSVNERLLREFPVWFRLGPF